MLRVSVQVTVGPYTVDFAQPLEGEEMQEQQQQKGQDLWGTLMTVDGAWSSSGMSPLQ